MEGGNRQQDQEQCLVTQVERENKPPPNLKCPRCGSTHTKFGYFNNHKTDQPRYLCKICKRYWTQGGKLRNVPFGGTKRCDKRIRDSSSSSCVVSKVRITSPPPPPPTVVIGNFNRLPTTNIMPQISAWGGSGMSFFSNPPQASAVRQLPMTQFENGILTNLDVSQGFNNVSTASTLEDQLQNLAPMQPDGQFYETSALNNNLSTQIQSNMIVDSLSGANASTNDANTNSIVGTNSTRTNTLWDYDIPINGTDEFSSSSWFDHLLGNGPPA